MSPREYLIWYYTSRAYTKRAVLLSMLLAIDEAVPASPVIGQVAYFNKKHNVWTGQDWKELDPVPNKSSNAYLPFDTKIDLKANDLPNLTKDITTSVGNVIVNILCLIHPFGNTFSFLEGKISAGKIEGLIESKFVDDGLGSVSPATMQKYIIALRMLMSVSGLFVSSATRKNTLPAPGVEEFKQKLNKQYDLNNTLHQSQYVEELIKYDENYLQGDPALNIMMSGKVKNRARIKLYASFGVETSFGSGDTTRFITNSLNGGIPTDAATHAELYTAMRAASYSRGKLTAVGGTLAKLLARITSEVTLTPDDCGTTKYLLRYIDANSTELLGRYMVGGKDTILITKDVLIQFDRKMIAVRSPGFCLSPGTSFCRKCAGEMLYSSRNGLRISSQSIADGVTTLMLKAMHGLDLSSSKIGFESIAH